MDYSATTAVLFFAQSARVESTIKPIASSLKHNILLWKKMNNRALKTIQKSKLPYFISDENNQVGSAFGERMTQAIQAIFTKGFEKVIVIGNDCIELKVYHLLQAEQDLKTNDLVIGSDSSGGTYLIGVTKSEFKADSFKIIPWQTKTLFKALQGIYNAESIAYLPCLNDCNTSFDFKRATYELPYSDTFRKELLSFLSSTTFQNHFERLCISDDYHPLNFNKGSPCAF